MKIYVSILSMGRSFGNPSKIPVQVQLVSHLTTVLFVMLLQMANTLVSTLEQLGALPRSGAVVHVLSLKNGLMVVIHCAETLHPFVGQTIAKNVTMQPLASTNVSILEPKDVSKQNGMVVDVH